MPVTYDQGSTISLCNSVKDWLAAQAKPIYDAKQVGQPWAGTLKILVADPDDPSIEANVPCIAVGLPEDYRPPENLQLGGGLVWVYKQFFLCCYPNVDSSGKPNLFSLNALESATNYAIGTAGTMPINDYSGVSVVNGVDFAYVDNQKLVNLKKMDSLGIARHRFDYHFTLRFTMQSVN